MELASSSTGLPTLHPSELRPGDLMLFRGDDPASRGIQLIDDGRYDHTAIVAPPLDERLWMYDVGFVGSRHRPVVEYPRVDNVLIPEEILVLRHRIHGWRQPVVRAAGDLVDQIATYDFERLLFLVLVSLTRFSSKLAANADPSVPLESQAAQFADGVFSMFRRVVADAQPPAKVKRICGEFVRDVFDVFDDDGIDDPAGRYFGLVLPDEPIDGLLQWAAGHRNFSDWLELGVRTRIGASPDHDPAAVLRDLRDAYQLTSAKIERASLDVPEFRDRIVTTAELVVRMLGVLPANAMARPAPAAVEASAWYMLDQILRRGQLVTPRNILNSGSLAEVGFVDIVALRRQAEDRVFNDSRRARAS